MSAVFFSLLTSADLTEKENAVRIADIWNVHAPHLLPNRIGDGRRKRITPDRSLADQLQEDWYIQLACAHVGSPRFVSSIFLPPKISEKHAAWSITLLEKASPEIQRELTGLLIGASEGLSADISYVHVLTRADFVNRARTRLISFLDRAMKEPHAVITTKKLMNGVPDVFWFTVFGKPYVELFGRETLLSAPVFAVHELKNGSVVLQSTDTMPQTEEALDQFDEVRSRVRKHLRVDAFSCELQHEPPVARVPTFSWETLH